LIVMEMPMNKFCRMTAVFAALLVAAPAWADHEHDDDGEKRRVVDEHRPLKPDARISVENTAGRIDVEVWDKNELHLTGELAEDVKELKISGTDAKLRIEVVLPKLVGQVDETILKLRVPAGVSLEAEGVSADIHVQGLRGAVSAESVSGDVTLEVKSPKVTASTVSGDVRVHGQAAETRANSVSGDVTVRGAKGEIRCESVSGDVRVEARDVSDLDVESVSGDISLDLALAKDADVSVEALSGEVDVTLPEMPKGMIKIETFSGTFRSDWLDGAQVQDYVREDKDGGKGRVKLTSFSGDIVLRKK
jgi:DUF4097 and DUF4098 domain-containing protein YvlB